MAASRGSSSRWVFSREQLESTPSRRCGVEPDRELSYRQQAANLIQDMGQRLNVSQLTINTAIVYMHRFFMHHSFTKFHRNTISPTTLFLAAKVEEQPRKLEYVIKVAHACLNPQESPLDTKSNAYLQQAQELVILESIVLQTLGFEITIDHPHTDVVKCSQLVRASKDLAQTSYFMATNSLHLTTFCLQHKPTVIACVCIHLACKWSNWEIPVSTDGKHWWVYVDSSVTLELLDELTHEFLQILEKTPSRLKRIRNWRATQAAKKPKSESSQLTDASMAGPSMLQERSLLDGPLVGVPRSGFPKAGAPFLPIPAPPGCTPLSLDSLAAGAFNPPSHSEWPQSNLSQAGICIKQEPLDPPHQAQTLPSQASALYPPGLTIKTEKSGELNIKQELKGACASKHQPSTSSSYPPPLSSAPKMSLDKYREKHAIELAASGQKNRAEQQHAALTDDNVRGDPSSLSQVDHRKYSQTHQVTQSGHTGGATASPIKTRVPCAMSGQDKRHHADKWDKGSLNLHLAIPASGGSSQSDRSKEELKMKIKLSSSAERHSSSDESAAAANNNNSIKSKHSSPLVSKEKAHRGHHKHAHSGNGQGASDGLFRGPPGLMTLEGLALPHSGSASLSSRKRAHPEVNHNQHPPSSSSSSSSSSCSKASKLSKGGAGAAGGLRTSRQYLPPSGSPHEVGDQRH
ncbi:cyclin-T2a isoform 1-T1 [Syngnathus typhle]